MFLTILMKSYKESKGRVRVLMVECFEGELIIRLYKPIKISSSSEC